VRFQITMHDAGLSSGSIYYDDFSLMLKVPVALTPSVVGGSISLSWQSQAATSYQVQYKDAIGDAWINGEVVPGNGAIVTRSYAMSSGNRFYRVLTL